MLAVLAKDKTRSRSEDRPKMDFETQRMIRVLTVLREYIQECDQEFMGERTTLPVHRACRGTSMAFNIRVTVQARQNEDFEVWTHSNAMLGSVRWACARRGVSFRFFDVLPGLSWPDDLVRLLFCSARVNLLDWF